MEFIVNWIDWSFWDEPWFPAAVYTIAIALSLVAALVLASRSKIGTSLTEALRKAPLLWIGSVVATFGAIGSLRSDSDWSRVAAIVAGALLVLMHFLGPRLQSIKYRDLELLMSEAEKAQLEGNEERSAELLRLLIDRLATREQSPSSGSGNTASTQRTSRPAWRTKRDIADTRIMAASDYEQWALRQITDLLPVEASIEFSARMNKPYDADVRYNGRHLAVDIRLGINFPFQEYARRLLGDFALLPESERPDAYILVVNTEPTSNDLDRLTRVLQNAKSSAVIAVCAVPAPPSTRTAQIDNLRLTLSRLLGFEA
jgi:hypothetical protein